MALDGKIASGQLPVSFLFTSGFCLPPEVWPDTEITGIFSGVRVFKSSPKVHNSHWLLLVLHKFYFSICYCFRNRTGLNEPIRQSRVG